MQDSTLIFHPFKNFYRTVMRSLIEASSGISCRINFGESGLTDMFIIILRLFCYLLKIPTDMHDPIAFLLWGYLAGVRVTVTVVGVTVRVTVAPSTKGVMRVP